MSEPKARAAKLEKIAPGVFRYRVQDDRIEGESDAFALVERGKTVLIDPLPLRESVLKCLGEVEAILLTASCHQRSAWRYRKRFGAGVYAPKGAKNLEEKADFIYKSGDKLPGGLRAVHAPGPTEAHYAFHRTRGPGILFCGDMVMNLPHEGLAFVPGDYQDDPSQTRASARKMLRLKFRVLCTDHGAPLRFRARQALAALIRKDVGG